MTTFEICPECYSRYFPIYKDMKIKTSESLHKCHGCGEMKKVVRKVTVHGKVIDIN